MLQFDNVSTFYGKIQALHGVSLNVERGEIVTLIGANGAGKSTLLMTLCGTPRAASGSIRYEGEELVGQDTCDIMRKSIAVVPEGRRIFARLTVEENLAMGAFFTRKEEYQRELEHVLTLFPRLKERFSQRGGTMSGGEQQMCAIGRGLMSAPRLLMIDELSLGLSPLLVEQLVEALIALNREGLAILVVEQDVVAALEVSSHAFVMDQGRVVQHGPSDQLLADPAVRKAYLGALAE